MNIQTTKHQLSSIALVLLLLLTPYTNAFAKSPEKKPIVTIKQPVNNSIVYKNKILFKGSAINTKTLLINGNKILIDKNGTFNKTLPLAKSNAYNAFTIKAFSSIGQLSSQSLKIFYNAQKPPIPKITLTTPAPNHISSKPSVVFSGQTLNTHKLLINKKRIPLNKNGSFSITKKLTQPNKKQPFTLTAISPSGAHFHANRNILYSAPAATPNKTIAPKSKLEAKQPNPISKKDQTIKTKKETAPNKINSKKTAPPINTLKSKLPPPILRILYPVDNSSTDKDYIVIKGYTKQADTVLINGQKVELSKKNEFSKKIPISLEKETHSFVIAAIRKSDNARKEKTLTIKSNISEKKPKTTTTKNSKTKTVAETPTSNSKKETTKSPIPKIIITSPEDNFISYRKNITIEGQVKNTKELFINNKAVSFDQKGNFKEILPLPKSGKHVFNLYALGDNNLTNSTLIRVFRVNKTPTENTPAQKFNNKLNKKISLELEDADIKDVLLILSKKSGLNIVFDKSLSGEVSFYLKNTTIKNAINHILNSQGISYKIEQNTILVGSKHALENTAELQTFILKINYAKAKDIETVIAPYLSSNENVQAVEKDNLLIITAEPSKLKELQQIANRIDEQKVPQVLIVAQIVEISSTELEKLGVSWPQSLGYSIGEGQEVSQPFDQLEKTLSISGWVINTLQQEGKAKILAKPQIKVVNKEEANIFIGDKIPYVEIMTDQSGRLTEMVKFVNTGITLQIQPDINTSTEEINLSIAPEVSYVNGYRGRNNDIPILRTRKVSTRIIVKDGETAVIGGLFNSSDSIAKSKLPFIGNLPLLGNLFSSSQADDQQTELIITVTPKIIHLK
jgi:hypothetical protein